MFSNVLRTLRKKHHLTQEQLGIELDLAKSTISMYENGQREPDFETLEAIADFFNVDMDQLTGRTALNLQRNIPKNIIDFPKMKKVPLLGEIACGTPILATENVETMIDMPEEIHATFALRCKGDSMVNARIFDRDIVFIREQPDVDNGEIAAVLIEDEATLKRVYKGQNKITLRAENPMYEDLVYTDYELDQIRILGKAVAFLSIVR